MKTLNFASSVLIGVTLVTRALALDVDPQLPAYKPVSARQRRDQIGWLRHDGRSHAKLGRSIHQVEPRSEDRSRKQGVVHSASCAD